LTTARKRETNRHDDDDDEKFKSFFYIFLYKTNINSTKYDAVKKKPVSYSAVVVNGGGAKGVVLFKNGLPSEKMNSSHTIFFIHQRPFLIIVGSESVR
jgi:hypothetical protein